MHVGRVMLVVCLLVFSSLFFFKQKTAYDMRISDWSSDVCFSDLVATSAPHAMSFRVAPMTDANAALTLGATTQGTLALPGDRMRYSFTLAEDALLLFDSLTNNGSLNWTLTGPSGVIDGRNLDRKSVVSGKRVSVRVDRGGCRLIKKKKTE